MAILLGALAAGALPPFHFVFLLWPAFVGLLWLLDGTTRLRAGFGVGWAFGFGFFLSGLYWVGIAFLVDAERYAAIAPLAVIGLAAGLSVFPALAMAVVTLSRTRGLARVFVLAAAWLLAEWLRSWVLTGFPWNLVGTAWVFSEAMTQIAALLGVWGLSALTVLAAALPALLGDSPDRRRQETPIVTRWAPLWVPLVLLATVWAGGALRLAMAPQIGDGVVGDVVVRLVQPSIPQRLKWREDHRTKTLAKLIELSHGPGFERVTHVVWPETAVPFDLSSSQDLRRWLAVAAPTGGALITGAPRRARDGGRLRILNSLHAIDSTGDVVATYDKFHLVPFGEYVPMGDYLSFSKLTAGRLDFSPGPGPRTLSVPGLPPLGALICYEVIFPGAVTDSGQRPSLLLTITNDAWFGESTGPFQHFAAARLRAIEEGLPVIRAANNGISGVVDGFGRVIEVLAINEIGVIDARLPRRVEWPTPFSRLGNWSVLLLLSLFSVVPAMSIANRISRILRP